MGKSNVVGDVWLLSSANPEDRKSAQDGVVGRPKSVFFERGPDRRLENSRAPPADPFALAELSSRPEKPMSSKRDQDGSGVVASGEDTDWFVDEIHSSTRRHSSVKALTESS